MHEKISLEKHEDLKALIKYSNNMQGLYKNVEEYYPDRKCKVLIVFDDMIADMIWLLIWLKISTVFIGQS